MDFEDDIRREGRFVTAPDGTPAAIDDRKGFSSASHVLWGHFRRLKTCPVVG
jgi:hypothetical protein